jgi:hypothetical protein
MLRSKMMSERIISHIGPQLTPGARRKLKRRRPRVFIMDVALSRAFDAGIVPPSEEASERDWATFFEELLKFISGLLDIFERFMAFYPADKD